MSDIRRLLSDAQDAERRGKKDEASRLLRVAAAWYRDRQMLRRAAQMLRQARRVEGIEENEENEENGDNEEEELVGLSAPSEAVFGFGDQGDEPAAPGQGRALVEQRVPQLADPAIDAWCSFCCRPKSEIGSLVAGPAGAYVCQGCLDTSASLLGKTPADRPPAAGKAWEVTALPFELRTQRRARARFTQRRPRLALVIGPEGTGKTAWLQSLGGQPDLRQLEIDGALTAAEEDELLAWLAPPGRSAFLVVRSPVPAPALVLQGEYGDEPLHDTASLIESIPQLSARVLAQVDAVLPFEPPNPEELVSLAQAMAQARGVSLPEAALAQLVGVSLRARRGAHELAMLIARVPPGKYS